jgi:transposase
MTRPYSNDLRERLATSVAAGRSCRETATLFGVSVATVVRCSQRWRKSGSAAAKPQGGARRRVVLKDERGWLEARLAEEPHATVRQLAGELATRGIKASKTTVWAFLVREGLSFPPDGPARRRAGSQGRRPAAPAVAKASSQG